LENSFDALIKVEDDNIIINSNIKEITKEFFIKNIQDMQCDKLEINKKFYWVLKKDNLYIIDKFECLNNKIEEFEKNAIYDGLTGCYNKKESEIFIQQLLHTYSRYKKEPFSILMLDIDFFKKINDTYGHLAGDIALKEMAKIVFSVIRDSDLFGRYGGEEFLVVLPNTKITGALRLAKRIKDSIENNIVHFDNKEIKFTISIGVTSIGINDNYESLISRVDEALYEAKQKGRNRIEYR